ncbi:helix-turn-helix domain-containing protein [Nocardia sp. NPDC058497]|uniref:helix-turn-helix domain-containing protein n=1 Tax=Nocardia sp. NPDC058497 TaxID=3346529 RepID=UPI00364B43A3
MRKWRVLFQRDRVPALADESRPGTPRTISDEQVDKLIAATLESTPPQGDTHWSTRSMAGSAGMSQSAVSRIWRAFGLKPHVAQSWKLSTEPAFV